MDAVIRWSPHATPEQPRFVILNLSEHNLKFVQADRIDGTRLHYKQVSQRSKLPTIRAFDWSPTDEALVAFGLPSGEAAVVRIDDNSNELLSFTVKHQRLCNAVALSTKGLLAAGLDKVRNDFCLNIWDVGHRLASWDRTRPGWASARPQAEPIRKLATSETISSIKFFTDQPDSLVTGVKGQFVRIYDLRDSPGNPSVQFATRCAHSLSIDPRDENYFASASGSGEPVVCVWDRRMTARASAAAMSAGNGSVDSYQAGAVLELRNCLAYEDPSKPPAIWSLRFCKYKRASLAVLGSNGQLQVFETDRDYVDPTLPDAAAHQPLLWTRQIRSVQHAYDDVSRGGNKETRVVSFDFAMSSYRIVGYRADGNLEIFTFNPPAPVFDLSIDGGVLAAGETRLGEFQPARYEGKTVAEMVETIRSKVAAAHARLRPADLSPKDGHASPEPVLSRRRQRQQSLAFRGPPGWQMDVADVLALHTVERRRAEEGYLFNCQKNAEIVADDPWLQDLWLWLDGAEEAAKHDGMVSGRLDLSFLGVHAVWTGELGPSFASRLRERDGPAPSADEFVQTVRAINRHHGRAEFDGVETAHPEQRQLCLAICGWAMSPEEFEAELRHIEGQGFRMKAAAWATFHDKPERAIEALFEGSDSERLVAMALAGYYGNAGRSEARSDQAWAMLCKQIAGTARDPWSRAILALVGSGWAAVIAEESLPLRDRVGVALRYFGDDELTGFLAELTADCIEHGDLEGVCLTGLGEEAMSLLQKVEDAQTAVLALSFAAPLYVDGPAFRAWRAEYRARLDRYELHLKRALYDTQHTKKSRTRSGRILVGTPARQMTVRCNFCDQSIAHDGEAGAIDDPSTAASSGVHPGNPLAGPGSSGGTTCPRCNHHLPRCGVCLMWLGTADPRRPGGSAAAAAAAADGTTRALSLIHI
ncbi:MAG: hypothetical protein M1832_000921 [Thelocarpon impressellum]|nr:MAG: hypothetical protein M1832_000921 [Thelocarpon impressellum]